MTVSEVSHFKCNTGLNLDDIDVPVQASKNAGLYLQRDIRHLCVRLASPQAEN